MSQHSPIEWTDATWNPVTGCTEVSPGCERCYARTFAERFRGVPGHHFEHGFDVQLRPDKLTAPLGWRRPRRIFVNSMSDLFHTAVPDEFIAQVFAVMAATPQHTYQVLTKRHGRMRSLLSSATFGQLVARQGRRHTVGCQADWLAVGTMLRGAPLPNVWLGVSAEDQKRADLRIPALVDTPAAVRFVSCEPLLGPVSLWNWTVNPTHPHRLTGRRQPLLDWVIVGGESGPGARPMHPDWARALREQTTSAGAAFLFKQWGAWAPVGPDAGAGRSIFDYVTNDDRCQIVDQAGHLRGRPWPGWRIQDGTRDAASMRRYGKHAAGRLLDGRTWDDYPTPPEMVTPRAGER